MRWPAAPKGSSGWCSRRTTPVSRSRATAGSSRRRSAGAPLSSSSSPGTTTTDSSASWPTASAGPRRMSCSPRTRCRRGSSPRVTRTGTSCWRPRSSSRTRPRSTTGRSRSRASRPTGEPWLGPDILDHLGDLHARGRSRRPGLPRRVRFRPSRDPLGHRHRGARPRARARPAPRANRDAERRPALRRGARRDRPALARCTRRERDSTTPARSVVDRVSRPFARLPEGAQRTIKDVVRPRRPRRAREVQALRDVSVARRARRGGRARRP